jgi:integrase
LERNLKRIPATFGMLGFSQPTSANAVTREMVLAFKENPVGLRGGQLLPGTVQQMLLTLRQFLRAEKVPLAEEDALWRVPKPVVVRRRWVEKETMSRLLNEARGRERIPVFLGGTNGLRSIEVIRLTVGNVNLALPTPTLTVHGKGRGGGKWRTIPLSPLAYPVMVETCRRKRPSDPVYPLSHRTLQKDVANVGARLGIPLSSHDLRRSFGRIAYYAGVPIVTLKNLYGHESVDMTAHYVGVDQGEMRDGLSALSKALRPEAGLVG